ncbi:vWA domain-containing protein [Fredinandcohnia sp. 179-A 10B2 NHS]|uniref:vWA domain-containing protein n=1 Tax=Fredinandcohnia sp. 179-A 10B2 NHS TaxID=3235176 RepID=UPI0039A3EE21
MKKIHMLLFLILFILVSCSDDLETNNEKTQDSTPAVENSTVEETEDNETPTTTLEEDQVWPFAFNPNETVHYSFPADLGEAEDTVKGTWWSKLHSDQLSDSDKEDIQKVLLPIIESERSNEEKATVIRRFLAGTFFPDLPGMSTFEPRGKINLEEVETKSNIKLNGREVKENINVAIILDASGSMLKVQGGKTLMDIAKESINNFTSNLPENAKVSLTVYGHKGSNSDKDKELSCSSIEEIYPLSSYESTSFDSALQSISPSGWTSMAESLKHVGNKLSSNENATNVIYLVSDGRETCDGNPSEEAKLLAQSNVQPIINVIGLAVTGEDADQLKEIAENAEGRYINAKTQQELDKEFEESTNTINQWIDWHRQNTNEAMDQLSEDKDRLIDLNRETVDQMMLFRSTSIDILMELNSSGKLESDIYNIVYQSLDNFYNDMYTQKDAAYNEKFKQIEDTYNETREEIDETYNTNTD